MLDLVSKHLRKLQIKPEYFQNGLLTWCKVREGDTFLTFLCKCISKITQHKPDPDSCSKGMRYRKGGKLKRIKKKLVAVVLAVNMLVIGIFGSYQTAQAAEIVAGYGAAQILESILLSFGISIFTADMIKNGSNATWWDTDGSAALKPYYDDLEQAYEEQRFKVINGGGGQDPSHPRHQLQGILLSHFQQLLLYR